MKLPWEKREMKKLEVKEVEYLKPKEYGRFIPRIKKDPIKEIVNETPE